MTSQINYNNIDGTYPIAGQDNSSQGFRDNFTNTKSNFQIAYDEITDLQSKVLLKAPLNGGTLSNDMQGNLITNALTQGFRELAYAFGSVSGPIIVDFNVGAYQTLTLAGNTTITFANFTSLNGQFAKIRLQITVTDPSYTLALSGTFNNIGSVSGANANTIGFDAAGIYVFELSTLDGGTTFNISDLTRNYDTIHGGNLTVTALVSGNATAGITMSVINVGGVAVGNITATNFIGNFISAGNAATYTGNLTAGNVIATNNIYGNIATATQPNITLLGTLTSLSVSGNANIGNLTTTYMTDMCGGDMYGVQFANAVNSGSTQIYSNIGVALINPTSSTIAAHTIIMPQTPMNGQIVRIAFANIITSLTQSGSGSDTVNGAISTANTSVGTTWVYYKNTNVNSGNGAWYRIG